MPRRPLPRARLGRRVRARLAWLLAVVAAQLVLAAVPAHAHASLVETTPRDGDAVAQSPDQVVLTFNEPMVVVPGGVRAFATDGTRVDDGDAVLDPDDASVLRADLRPDLPDGGYVVTWRAVSADGHPVRGAFVFTVGAGESASDDVVAALFAGSDDRLVGALATVDRAVGYAGSLVAFGALAFLVGVARRRADRERALQVARVAAVAAGGAALLAPALQSMVVTGRGLGALAPATVWQVAAGSVGPAALVVLVGSIGVVALASRDDGGPGAGRVAAVVGAVAALGWVLEGHTRTQEPTAVLLVADAVHVLTAGAWAGGLVVLGGALRSRRRADDPVGAAHLLAGFSRLALVSVLAAVAAGTAQSWVTVRAARALTSTAYGWTLLAKSAVVAALVGVAVHNHRHLVPAVVRAATGPRQPVVAGGAVDVPAVARPPVDADDRAARGDAAWHRLSRTVRLEVVGLAVVVAVTAVLVNLQPAAQEAGITGAFSSYVDLGTDGRQVNVVVDPNRAGSNQVHLYVLDVTGRPAQDVTSVEVSFTQTEQDIGPLVREPFVAGPGHWQVDGNVLSVPGPWTIEVAVETGRLDLQTVSVPLVVNP